MPITKHLRHAIALSIWLTPYSAQADDITIKGYNQLLDMDCADVGVIVEGVKHGLNFTGDCVSMTVSGVENMIDFETADTIMLEGSANRLQGALAGAGPESGPDVTLSGSDNVLTLRFDRPAVVKISGSGNRLVWAMAPGVTKPDIRITGENNMAENE
ncbi:MAG: DUF3060 domain-containing protein [Paracoccaceae bacterium]